MNKRLVLTLGFLVSAQSAQAIMMTPTGLDTGCGVIKWEQLVAMPGQIKTLQRALAVTTVLLLGVIAYEAWGKGLFNVKKDEATPEKA